MASEGSSLSSGCAPVNMGPAGSRPEGGRELFLLHTSLDVCIVYCIVSLSICMNEKKNISHL